ncbi:enoyl-CoA hydratase-related protein [Kerstersia gyiorum]|uniref:enoyl-CoA hydratase-related protein n=1 Tax=Kerstersia gyiorum TaxID=206506 RepID=UPI0020A1A791|nr:enoyl-CoA hydratase-related protein [Kerstersia gyiorum]MCP1632905.1 enoyl-CoA hydratase/carnithine racemase [Kerstersia gyiorum]MCP1635563.1 enoyl-CoA hydratase/carnithine racemase [Kerstersia gyiorum]MCP1671031.1 enoyl-CoA hydratase/carnithine racemase [Kerstersia gyiorum]MCP1678314.1 enoyl-CoA hydratase/carnithine racemase [Kerstersia gyiorum]MCP1682114.1 enoyl-CoA hydratase/carnithine racemase [Kerstersia gyiorum]
MTGEIRLERQGHVATVTIDNPGKRNAMSQAMWIAMGDIILGLSADPTLRCILLRGAGDEAFGSGADISEFEQLRSSRERAIAFARHGHRAMHALRDCPIPTVAAIRGACVGGGLELAAYCDLRIAGADSRFGVPIARLGAVLAYPELDGLIGLAGPNAALELLLEGRIWDADEALLKGLVNRVVSVDRFDEEVQQTVARIVANAPLSARWHKRFVRRLRSQPAALNEAELAEGYACYDTEDYVIGYQAFLARVRPQFKGK